MPGDAAAVQKPFVDDFRQPILDPEWKWPIGHAPIFHIGDGRLVLESSADEVPVVPWAISDGFGVRRNCRSRYKWGCRGRARLDR